MKRIISLLLALICILPMTGCSESTEPDQETVTFYYRRVTFDHHGDENVIASEERSFSGDRGDLSYLLRLYMMGPVNEELVVPFPANISILDIRSEEHTVQITLSGMDQTIGEADFTVAASCLAMTVLGLSEYETVLIYSGERSISLQRDNILLTDGT